MTPCPTHGAAPAPRSLFLHGPQLDTTRAYRWLHPRRLACVRGHEFAASPFVYRMTGACCAYRGDTRHHVPACAACGLFLYLPHLAVVLVVETTARELHTILERDLGVEAALALLGVPLPPLLAPPLPVR